MEGGHRLQEGMYEPTGVHGMGCVPQNPCVKMRVHVCMSVCPSTCGKEGVCVST